MGNRIFFGINWKIRTSMNCDSYRAVPLLVGSSNRQIKILVSKVLLILDGHFGNTHNIDVITLDRENNKQIISITPYNPKAPATR